MKISPLTAPSGTPGQTLSSVDVGRTADPVKMERARAIARGEKVGEPPADSQAERVQRDVRKIKMRTQRSTNRDESASAEEIPQNSTPNVAETEPAAVLSSTPQSTETPAAEVTQPLSPQFAALAKQKRALQLERAEFEKLKSASPQGDQDFVAKIKSNPLGVLREHGVLDSPEFYNSITEHILGNQANPEILELKAKIEALEKGVETKFQSRQESDEEAALTEMLYEAEGLAKEGEAYELIRERDAYDQVLGLIHSTYKKTGRVLDVSEAMNTIENRLLSDAEKLANLNKVRSKMAPPPLQSQQPKQMRTLTARDSTAAPMTARQRAIAAFTGTLRK